MSTERIIIALHGAGMQASVWETLAEKLSGKISFLSLSLPGHGKADAPLLPSIETMAAWVEKQIGNHAPQSVVLMGHSMGALVALEAAKNPAVAALVLIGAAAQMPVHPDLLKQATAAPDAAAALILKWGVSPAHSEATGILKQHMQPGTLANDLSACNAYQTGETAARNARQPALVLGGADDKLTKPAAAKALADILPQGRFHFIQGSGHMLMIEDPVEIAKEISSFIVALPD